MSQPATQSLFPGQPPGFTTLFFTELWERFSYYGMRALLVLFLTAAVADGGFGLTDSSALAIYGLYTAGVYIMSMPGGWVADRLLGAQRAVFWGGATIAAGHVLLAIAGATEFTRLFLLGLVAIVLGTGLLKPNISAMVGQLHDAHGTSTRDAGFTWFYFGINVGALLGPLVAGTLGQKVGWHWGFLAAAVGMVAGLIYYSRTRAQLGEAGRLPTVAGGVASPLDWRIFRIVLAAAALIVLLFFFRVVQPDTVALRDGAGYVMVAGVIAYFLWLLSAAGLTAGEKRGVVVLAVLVAASALFWAGFEQAGSSLNLFADRHTNRMIGGREFPSSWFQSVNSTFLLLLAPLLAGLWSYLAARGRDLNVFVKFALGLAGMGLGFLVLVGAAKVIGHSVLGATGGAGPVWLIATYFFHTVAELCLSPVGMSATTRLAPKRFAGQAMGLWFTSIALGSLFGSQLAGSIEGADAKGLQDYFFTMFLYGAGGAIILLVLSPLLKRWYRPDR